MTLSREKAVEAFNRTELEHTPLIWHVWKRAFDAGYYEAPLRQNAVEFAEWLWKNVDEKDMSEMSWEELYDAFEKQEKL